MSDVGKEIVKRLSKFTKSLVEAKSGSSHCYADCERHRFLSHRKDCPYCKIEAGFYLAIGSRDTLRDWADVMRSRFHPDDDTIDHLIENFDRLAEIIKEFEETENHS
jgi:hypothetical protein